MESELIFSEDGGPVKFINEARDHAASMENHDMVAYFDQFESFYEKKLWHQLTITIESFISEPSAAKFIVPFYYKFVSTFEQKLNKLSLVSSIGFAVAKQLPDHSKRIEYLRDLGERVRKLNPVSSRRASTKPEQDDENADDVESICAELLANTQASHYDLVAGNREAAAKHVRQAGQVIDKLGSADPRLSCAFYRLAADYYMVHEEYGKFYRTALLFLSCLPMTKVTLTSEELDQQMQNLAVAALMSDEIYNFGELLSNAQLEFLGKTSPNTAWLKHALFVFNSGDINGFEKLADKFETVEVLRNGAAHLKEKIRVMALIDYAFSVSATERSLKFSNLAERLKLDEGNVEYILMRAMSLDLIRGSIDQINQSFQVEWVAPRILSREDISGLISMLDAWNKKIKSTTDSFERDGAKVFSGIS